MAEYIEREVLTNALDDLCNRVCAYSKEQRYVMCGSCPLGSAFDMVEELPAADVVPVVHGKWVIDNPKQVLMHCSNCNWCNLSWKWKYCPNCGAAMDGET